MIQQTVNRIAKLTNQAIQETADLFEKDIKEFDDHRILTQFFLSKTVTSYFAVWILCKNGYGQDALVILRTIFENLVNLSYVNKYPDTRVPLFIEYDHIRARQKLQDYEKCYSEFHDEESRKYIMEQYDRVKNHYPKKFSWSRVSLFDMAKSCGLEKDYYRVYTVGSEFIHGGSDTVSDYIKRNESHFDVRFGERSKDKTNFALLSACSLVLTVIQEACKVFALEPPSCCNEVEKRITKAKGMYIDI